MKKGGAGTAILIILLLLIIIVLLFPNQVEQFLKQVNIPVGNNTYNLGQLFQQFINGSQNYVSNNNYYSYENYTEVWVAFPIFNASTYNMGVSNEVTFLGPALFAYGPSSESQVNMTGENISIYENGNNIDFSINLQDINGCNNINSVNIQNATLGIFIYSFNPTEVGYYNTYFSNLNYITADEFEDLYGPLLSTKKSKLFVAVIQNNQYGFSCEPNSIAIISCNIDVNQLELNPQIQNIMNEINFAGNLSIWYGLVYLDTTYNCQ